jgi:hypothetical protein
MSSVGAVYCVYDACNFLEESVLRIYPLVGKVVFLLNFKPWSGDSNTTVLTETYKRILNISDSDNKIQIFSQFWLNEESQRNFGLEILRNQNIEWCLVIDDDEMFNRSDLIHIFNSLDTAEHVAYLFYHQIYWKNRETIIEGLFGSFPSLINTNGLVYFNENRTILVKKNQTWFTISAENIVCHHFSYIRSYDSMLQKVKLFSHAKDLKIDWFKEKWLNWLPSTADLHPIQPSVFKRAVPSYTSSYELEKISL